MAESSLYLNGADNDSINETLKRCGNIERIEIQNTSTFDTNLNASEKTTYTGKSQHSLAKGIEPTLGLSQKKKLKALQSSLQEQIATVDEIISSLDESCEDESQCNSSDEISHDSPNFINENVSKLSPQVVQFSKLKAENEQFKQEIEHLKKQVTEREKKLLKFSVDYENLLKKLSDITVKVDPSLTLSITDDEARLENQETNSSLSLQASSSDTYSRDTALQSLPFMSQSKSDESSTSVGLQKLKSENQSLKSKIQVLTDMNVQWQLYDKQRKITITDLQGKLQNKEQEISQLQAKEHANEFSGNISFTPKQQEYIDQFYQNLRKEADRSREQHDSAIQEAQRNIAEANKKEKDATHTLAEEKKKTESLRTEVASLSSQIEELRIALVVATRTQWK